MKEIDYVDFCFKFFSRCFCDTFWWVGCDLDKCRKLTREHSLSSWLTWSIRDHLLRHRSHHPLFHHPSSPIITFVIITYHRLPTLCRCARFHTSSNDREQSKTRVQRPTCWEGDKILMAAQKNNIIYWFIISDCIYVPRNIINTLEVPHRTVSQDKGQSLSLTMSGSNEPLSHRLSHIFMCICAQAKPRDPSSYIEELGFVQRFYISGPQRVI